MSLPDEQELDQKRPMVSPAAAQRNQTVSHKQQEKQGLKCSREGSKHQLSLKRKLHHTMYQRKGRLFRTPSSQSATDCLFMSNTPRPFQRRSNGTASEGD